VGWRVRARARGARWRARHALALLHALQRKGEHLVVRAAQGVLPARKKHKHGRQRRGAAASIVAASATAAAAAAAAPIAVGYAAAVAANRRCSAAFALRWRGARRRDGDLHGLLLCGAHGKRRARCVAG
jgi:hypothetical protein